MSDEIKRNLASTKPVKDFILVCTDEKTRKMEYINPQLLKLEEEYFISDLIDDKERNKENIARLVDAVKLLTDEHNNLLNAFNAYKTCVEARLVNLEETIKEMGGNL